MSPGHAHNNDRPYDRRFCFPDFELDFAISGGYSIEVVVVDPDGQEYALAWRLAHLLRVQVVYVAPDNSDTTLDGHLQNPPITDPEMLATFAEHEGIYFMVVGPEVPLAAGIIDLFRARGLRIFGPAKAATQLESSKDLAKAFMHHHGISAAGYQTSNGAVQTHAYTD